MDLSEILSGLLIGCHECFLVDVVRNHYKKVFFGWCSFFFFPFSKMTKSSLSRLSPQPSKLMWPLNLQVVFFFLLHLSCQISCGPSCVLLSTSSTLPHFGTVTFSQRVALLPVHVCLESAPYRLGFQPVPAAGGGCFLGLGGRGLRCAQMVAKPQSMCWMCRPRVLLGLGTGSWLWWWARRTWTEPENILFFFGEGCFFFF